ncbi:MAG TPA: hypothetical protein VM097_09975 [Mycobacteriales bacterium]|nr:hypothetical protein [Mycobacteriales bacterium]
MLGLAAAALALQSAPAEGTGGDGREQRAKARTVAVHSHFAEPSLSPDGLDCRPSSAEKSVEEVCKLHLIGPSTFTGTIHAKAALDYLAWPSGTKLKYTGTVLVRGSVAGCGVGSFVMDYPSGIVDQDEFDPATQSYPGRNPWVFRKGSGTGQLARLVSGSGMFTFRVYPLRGHDESDTFAEGDITGTLTCLAPHEPRARSH